MDKWIRATYTDLAGKRKCKYRKIGGKLLYFINGKKITEITLHVDDPIMKWLIDEK